MTFAGCKKKYSYRFFTLFLLGLFLVPLLAYAVEIQSVEVESVTGSKHSVFVKKNKNLLDSNKLKTPQFTSATWTGTVTVNITPEEAAESGIYWRINGGKWLSSGAVASGVAEGNYDLEFLDSYKWQAPANQTISVIEGRLNSISVESLRKKGSITINLLSAEAISAGAQWRLRGGEWQDSGNTVPGLAVDNYIVEFSPLAGWVPLQPQTVALKPSNVIIDVDLEPKYSSLEVNIEPPEAAQGGAQWRIIDSFWNDGGDVINELRLGDYVIEYALIPGYVPPTLQRVSVGDSGAIITAKYRRLAGSVSVSLSPNEAIVSGAMWRLSGGQWQRPDTTLSGVSEGAHTIEYAPLDGWYTPSSQVVWVDDGFLSYASGSYAIVTGELSIELTPNEALAEGALWRIQGGQWQASGGVIYNLPVGDYVIEFSNATGWITPATQRVSVGDQLTQLRTDYAQVLNSNISVNIQPAAARYAGAQWRIFGKGWNQDNSQIFGLSSGLYSIEFSSIPNWQPPAMQTISLDRNDHKIINATYLVGQNSTPVVLGDLPLQVDEMASAVTILADGASVADALQAGENRVYTFNAVQGRTYLILLQGGHRGRIIIYSENGEKPLARSSLTADSDFGRVEWVAPNNGQFYAKVEYYNRGVSGAYSLTILVKGVAYDFNGDGVSDILNRDSVTGDITLEYMNGNRIVGGGLSANQMGVNGGWSLAGVADLNGDGLSDILWRNLAGEVNIWLMDGLSAKVGSGLTTVTMSSQNKQIIATADFDGDGRDDILWQDRQTSQLTLWAMAGRNVLPNSGDLNMKPRSAHQWIFAGTGDFNGDFKADILWRSTINGYTSIWFMNGHELLSSNSSGLTSIHEPLSSAWYVKFVADFNGDGLSDVLWHDSDNGVVRIWFMDARDVYHISTDINLGFSWDVLSVGDYNGDGKSDLLLQDTMDQSLYMMFMNGEGVLPMSSAVDGVSLSSPGWNIIAK